MAICARRREELEETIADLGPGAYGAQVDVIDTGTLRQFVDDAADALGGIDLLVACAGGLMGGPGTNDIDADAWRFTLDVNVTHPAIAATAARHHMAIAGRGSIVFISSIAGMHPWTRPHYGAAKAAENHLAASLARELAPDGIRVNSVSPGSIMFEGSAWASLQRDDPAAFERWLDHELPFKRLGTDQEVADVTAFLLSARASWVNGANVPVDGGQLPPNMRTTQPMPGSWRSRS